MTLPPPRTLVYHVFVDRFAADGGGQLGAIAPDAQRMEAHTGGTLGGIAARIDHVTGLGADALYLTPVFRARSNHKYDAASWTEVDPRFGGDAGFDALAAACRERGVGLVLDGVFNHIGCEHPWFRAGAADARCPEHDYLRWIEHPDSYHRWRGHGMLPEVNLANPQVREFLFGGSDSVIRTWLRRGATGWRLDCANDLGARVCGEIARTARSEGAPDGVVGEVMSYAEDWIGQDGLDGVMNYYFRETVLGLLTGEVPVVQAAYNLKRMARCYHYPALLRSWNILSSHDTPRLASLLPEIERRIAAVSLAFAYPGVPTLYYGEETGQTGGGDPENRGVMDWEAVQRPHPVAQVIHRLTAIRRTSPALREGAYLPMPQPGAPHLLTFARVTARPQETVIAVLNASASPVRERVFAPHSHLFDTLPLRDLLGAAPGVRMVSGRFDVDLPPWGVALYQPEDGTIPGYRFFRNQ